MVIDVVMPKMGESITEGTILEWYKKIGDEIEQDETLLEIGTDKVDSEIPSPSSGVITMIMAEPNDVVDVGEVIARIETDSKSVNLEKSSEVPKDQKPIEKPEKVVKEKDVQIQNEQKSFNINKVKIRNFYKKYLSPIKLFNTDFIWGKYLPWINFFLTKTKEEKKKIISTLRKNNVMSNNFWLPMHKHPIKKHFILTKYPNTNYIYDRILVLPSSTFLLLKNIKKITNIIKKI